MRVIVTIEQEEHPSEVGTWQVDADLFAHPALLDAKLVHLTRSVLLRARPDASVIRPIKQEAHAD